MMTMMVKLLRTAPMNEAWCRYFEQQYPLVRIESPETAADVDEAAGAVPPHEAAVAPGSDDYFAIRLARLHERGRRWQEEQKQRRSFWHDEPGELERMRRVFATWDFRSGT